MSSTTERARTAARTGMRPGFGPTPSTEHPTSRSTSIHFRAESGVGARPGGGRHRPARVRQQAQNGRLYRPAQRGRGLRNHPQCLIISDIAAGIDFTAVGDGGSARSRRWPDHDPVQMDRRRPRRAITPYTRAESDPPQQRGARLPPAREGPACTHPGRLLWLAGALSELALPRQHGLRPRSSVLAASTAPP